MKVVVCDDHRLFADALSELLTVGGHEVAGVTDSPASAARLCAESRAEVCVFGMDAGGLDGVHVVRTGSPRTKVIVVAAEHTDVLHARAYQAGAAALVEKRSTLGELLDRLARVGRGELVMTEAVPDEIVRRKARTDLRSALLTARELEVLEHLATGASTPQIAKDLSIAVHTVRAHSASIRSKLGVRTRVEALTAAFAAGLLRPPWGSDPPS